MEKQQWGLLVSSALAGSLCRIPTHPVDTLKSRLQSSSMSLGEIVRFTYKTEGWRGFYRGFAFTFMASLPASCLYFSSQEYSRKHLFSNALLSGFFAEAVACSIYTPIDVVKERIQASTTAASSSSNGGGAYDRGGLQALKHIVTTQNGLRGLYKGYWATLCSFGPFSALYFYFYEQVRVRAHARYEGAIPAHVFWLGAGASGAAAAWITTPLDLVKFRMQLDASSSYYLSSNRGSDGGGGDGGGRGWAGNLVRVTKQGGVRALFRGAAMRVLYFAPSTAFSMMIFETLKPALGVVVDGEEEPLQ